MQEHFERLSFLFSEMKVSVVLKHCAVKSKNYPHRAQTLVLTDEKENMTEPFCPYGREVLGGERKVRVYE